MGAGLRILVRSVAALAGVTSVTLSLAQSEARLLAQATPAVSQRPAFDAVSIRPNPVNAGARYLRPYPGGRLEIRGLTLREIIRFAYGPAKYATPSQVIGGPAWLETQRFDIDAAGRGDFMAADPAGGPPAVLLEMLRTMLEDRFKLQARPETQEQAYLELTTVKADALGPSMRPTKSDCTGRTPNMPPDPVRLCGVLTATPGILTARGYPMQMLAMTLGNFPAIMKVVRNQTGLTGLYDIDLAWTPELITVVPGGPPVPNPNAGKGPSLEVALAEQLGLRLVERKGPLDVVTIESVEMPTK